MKPSGNSVRARWHRLGGTLALLLMHILATGSAALARSLTPAELANAARAVRVPAGNRCIWIDRGTYRKPLADFTADETLSTLSGLPDLFAELGWMADR